MFWDIYVQLCDATGKSPNKVASELGFSSGSVTSWKQGRIPRWQTLDKIAKYFNVTTEALIGQSESSSENKNASAEGGLSEGNIVRLAGRDGSYFEKVLPDDLYEILKKFIDSLDGDHDPRL